MNSNIKLVAIKVGSNVITTEEGLPNQQIIQNIATQLAELNKQGIQTLLISSGAVAAGRSIHQFSKKSDTISQRQVLSSLGQVKLISLYKEIFDQLGVMCSQVLVTKEDFRSRTHYLNMQNCLHALLSNNIIPIINENDVVSVTELMFTDNDELAGLVSSMMNADALIILSNVDGIYNGDPDAPETEIIHEFDPKVHNLDNIVSNNKKSGFGRGGILTKCHTAQKIAKMGIPVFIANGSNEKTILQILNGEKIGTKFKPKGATSSIKKYIAHAQKEAKGYVMVNQGARDVLLSDHANSLLPVGIVEVVGKFKKGDIIKIIDEKKTELGLGIAKYNYKKATETAGKKNQKPIIHYDHLYLH